ncbi:MAG TPA: hypothetical protein PLU67_03370 [Candidatus Kapabacteria bacterium]|nr:hypothetical protein [Candidatus Kapabacteria bacterium]
METNEILKAEIKKLEEIIYDLNTQILTYYVYCDELDELILRFKENFKFLLNEFEFEFKTILESEVSSEELKRDEILEFIRTLKNRINEFEKDYSNGKETYKNLDILKENEILKNQIEQLKITIEKEKRKN